MDAVLSLLATAVERERERETQMQGMVDPHLAQREGFAAAAAAAAAAGDGGGVGGGAGARGAATTSARGGAADADGVVVGTGRRITGFSGSVPQGKVCLAPTLSRYPSRLVHLGQLPFDFA